MEQIGSNEININNFNPLVDQIPPEIKREMDGGKKGTKNSTKSKKGTKSKKNKKNTNKI